MSHLFMSNTILLTNCSYNPRVLPAAARWALHGALLHLRLGRRQRAQPHLCPGYPSLPLLLQYSRYIGLT